MSLVFRHAIVVGASSGIGAEIARQLAADGCAVALLGRREDELQKVAAAIAATGRGSAIVCKHDVTQYDTVPALLDQLTGQLGGLDLLVYAAGIMHTPGEGEYDFARDRAQIEVNLLGAMAWTTPRIRPTASSKSRVRESMAPRPAAKPLRSRIKICAFLGSFQIEPSSANAFNSSSRSLARL